MDGLSTGEEKALKITNQYESSKEGYKIKQTSIEHIFGSYLCNYCNSLIFKNSLVECLDCGFVSRTFDFCLDFMI